MRFHRPAQGVRTQKVSVVVPCYRYGRYLPTAVDSALEQDGVEVEVIIVDDASDDDSADVALSLAERDQRIELLVHTINAGHIATYNEGLAKATGDYLVLLSADDALVPGSLGRAVSLMQRHPGVGMVYGHSESFSDSLPEVDDRARSWTVWRGHEWVGSMCGRARNPVYTPGVVMRREAWEQIGAYDARTPHAADMLLWYQTAAAGWDIGRVNSQAQALYRVHGANMHLTQFAGMLRDLAEQREVVRILFDEPIGDWRPSPRVRAHALRAIGRRAARLADAAVRDGDSEGASAYRAFAAETSASEPGASVGRVARAADSLRERPGAGLLRRVERHLQWRMWRRYGV